MSWDLFRETVRCTDCGARYEYVVQHPPIPMIVDGFYDDEGRDIGDQCVVCDETLIRPAGAPETTMAKRARLKRERETWDENARQEQLKLQDALIANVRRSRA